MYFLYSEISRHCSFLLAMARKVLSFSLGQITSHCAWTHETHALEWRKTLKHSDISGPLFFLVEMFIFWHGNSEKLQTWMIERTFPFLLTYYSFWLIGYLYLPPYSFPKLWVGLKEGDLTYWIHPETQSGPVTVALQYPQALTASFLFPCHFVFFPFYSIYRGDTG